MFFSSPNHWQSIPILASIPEQIPGSLLALDHKQDTIEPPNKSRARNAAGSAGLSFIALFLCDERASIRKLKMYFAFRSPLPFPLLSGEKRMKCNKSETEMGTPHGAPGTGEESAKKWENEPRRKWQSHLAHCTLPGNSNTGSSGNYQQFTTILAPPLG